MKVSGALAWHPEVAMTQQEIDEFLSGRWVARLATLGKDGYPHIAPLWYYWDGECVYFALTKNRQSCKNLQRDPRCSVVIDMDDRPLIGMRGNLAKAVLLIGDATQMVEVGSGKRVVIGEAAQHERLHVPDIDNRPSGVQQTSASSGEEVRQRAPSAGVDPGAVRHRR